MNQRTGGMTAIGIVNIVLGTLGTLVGLLLVLGGGAFAAGGVAAGPETAGTELEGAGTVMAAGGAVIMVVGLIAAAVWATLLASGIGVLKLRPWGRTLSIICGCVILAISLLSLVTGGGVMQVLSAAYGGLLVFLFFKPDWKATYTGSAADLEAMNEAAAAPADRFPPAAAA